MQIQYVPSATLRERASQYLANLIEMHAHEPLLILLSGGSSLSLLDTIIKDIFTNNITISVLDERYTFDQTESNFAQIMDHPLIRSIADTVSFIDPRPKPNEDISETAQRFENTLIAWNTAHPKHTILSTQGVGGDGHTAGIFPDPTNAARFEKRFNTPEHLIVGYTLAPNQNPYPKRITVTLPFLTTHIDTSLVFISGEEKRKALQSVLYGPGNISATPAQIINAMRGTIYTDINI